MNPDACAAPRYCYLGNNVGLALKHDGRPIFVDTRDFGLTPHIAMFGVWERTIESVVSACCRPGDTVVEVGSNMGYHSLAMGAAIGPSGRLFCFEANAAVANLLEKTILVNDFQDRTTLFRKAALDVPQQIRFSYQPEFIGSGHVMSPDHVATAAERTEKVDATSIDFELVGKIDHIDVLRMDAEGSEPLILRGAAQLLARSPNIKIIQEWSVCMMKHAGDIRATIAWLVDQKFRFWRIGDRGTLHAVSPEGMVDLPHCDVVLCRQDPGLIPELFLLPMSALPDVRRNADAGFTDEVRRPSLQTIIWGPYIELPAGRYSVSFRLTGQNAARWDRVVCEVVTGKGAKIWAHEKLAASKFNNPSQPVEVNLHFENAGVGDVFEFRVWKRGGMKLTLQPLVVSKR